MKFIDKILGIGTGVTGQVPKDTVYAYWLAAEDNQTCDFCRSLNGFHWIPGMVVAPSCPNPSCTNPKGCRCTIVYILKGTIGADELQQLIRGYGGKATQSQINQYEEKKEREILQQRTEHDKASEIFSQAYKIEKNDPSKAVELYRQSINRYLELAKKSDDRWSWRDFAYRYNRLTLVLERLGRFHEVLTEIAKYEQLPHQNEVASTEKRKIEKRKIRIIEKTKE